MAKVRDPAMKTGGISSTEVEDQRASVGQCESRWYTPEFTDVLKAIYDDNGVRTIGSILDGDFIQFMPGNDGDTPMELEDAADICVMMMDPTLMGEKVFLLLLADIGERNLTSFEAGAFNDPAPRALIDGLRERAFGVIDDAALEILKDAAYDGENNRSDTSWLGQMALAPRGGKKFANWQGYAMVKFMGQYRLSDLEAIIARLKRYDTGDVDLADETTARL